MLIQFSGRGILIPVFLFISIIGIMILSEILREYVGGIFALEYDFQILMGIGTFISGLWTYFTSKDYIKVNGKKEEIYLNNYFFFLSIKVWAYILTFGGILILLSGVFETIDKFK